MIKCFKCNNIFESFSDLTIHFKRKKIEGGHEMKKNDHVQCMFNGCPRICTNRPAFLKHFTNSHAKELLLCQDSAPLDASQDVLEPIAPPTDQSTVAGNSLQTGEKIEPSNETVTFIQPPTTSPISSVTANEEKLYEDQKAIREMITGKIINFSALLNGIPSINSSQVQLCIDEVNSLMQNVSLFFKMQTTCLSKILDPEQFQILSSNMEESFSFINHEFSKFNSHYLQLKFFEKKGLYNPPQKINLGQVLKRRKRRRKIFCKITRRHKFKTSYQLVPVEESSTFLSLKKL